MGIEFWPCFEPEVRLETHRGPFQFQWFQHSPKCFFWSRYHAPPPARKTRLWMTPFNLLKAVILFHCLQISNTHCCGGWCQTKYSMTQRFCKMLAFLEKHCSWEQCIVGVWIFVEFSVVGHFVSHSKGEKLIVVDNGKVQWLLLEGTKLLLIFNYH